MKRSRLKYFFALLVCTTALTICSSHEELDSFIVEELFPEKTSSTTLLKQARLMGPIFFFMRFGTSLEKITQHEQMPAELKEFIQIQLMRTAIVTMEHAGTMVDKTEISAQIKELISALQTRTKGTQKDVNAIAKELLKALHEKADEFKNRPAVHDLFVVWHGVMEDSVK